MSFLFVSFLVVSLINAVSNANIPLWSSTNEKDPDAIIFPDDPILWKPPERQTEASFLPGIPLFAPTAISDPPPVYVEHPFYVDDNQTAVENNSLGSVGSFPDDPIRDGTTQHQEETSTSSGIPLLIPPEAVPHLPPSDPGNPLPVDNIFQNTATSSPDDSTSAGPPKETSPGIPLLIPPETVPHLPPFGPVNLFPVDVNQTVENNSLGSVGSVPDDPIRDGATQQHQEETSTSTGIPLLIPPEAVPHLPPFNPGNPLIDNNQTMLNSSFQSTVGSFPDDSNRISTTQEETFTSPGIPLLIPPEAVSHLSPPDSGKDNETLPNNSLGHNDSFPDNQFLTTSEQQNETTTLRGDAVEPNDKELMTDSPEPPDHAENGQDFVEFDWVSPEGDTWEVCEFSKLYPFLQPGEDLHLPPNCYSGDPFFDDRKLSMRRKNPELVAPFPDHSFLHKTPDRAEISRSPDDAAGPINGKKIFNVSK